jgi:hypothetical protein
MPDLILERYYHCATAREWETRIGEYTVKWGFKPYGAVEFDYSCDCKGYRYGKGKYCKHIHQAIGLALHCNWTQFVDGGEPVDNKCPKCGGPIESALWGV